MRKTVVFVCILLLPLVIIRVTSNRQSSEVSAVLSGLKSDEILVGLAWPFAENQDGMDYGAILAQEELNARRVMGKRIHLLIRDDGLDREISRKLAIEFAQNPRMTATIGYYDDKFAVRASAIFEQSHLLHIVIGANNTYMTTHGFQYLIRAELSNDKIGHKLALLGTGHGYHNFAVIAEDGAFGEDLAYQTCTGLDAMNARVVYQATYVPANVDFRGAINEIKEAHADAILFLGLEHESALFIKTARTMGLKTPIVGSFSDTPEMHAIAGAALEGVMFYDTYDVNSSRPENQAFVAKYRRRYGSDPSAYSAQSYDTLRILAKAIETTGSTNPLDLAYAIRYMDQWEGAIGPYKFDATGELQDKDIYLKVYRGGKPVVLATSQSLAPVAPRVVNESPVPY